MDNKFGGIKLPKVRLQYRGAKRRVTFVRSIDLAELLPPQKHTERDRANRLLTIFHLAKPHETRFAFLQNRYRSRVNLWIPLYPQRRPVKLGIYCQFLSRPHSNCSLFKLEISLGHRVIYTRWWWRILWSRSSRLAMNNKNPPPIHLSIPFNAKRYAKGINFSCESYPLCWAIKYYERENHTQSFSRAIRGFWGSRDDVIIRQSCPIKSTFFPWI